MTRSTNRRRCVGALLSSVLLAAFALVTVGAGAASAAAGCNPPDGIRSKMTHLNLVYNRPTGLHSDYIDGPATIGRVQTDTTSMSWSIGGGMGLSVGTEAIKISAETDLTFTSSWSKTSGWNYTKPVPKGKTARMMYFHRTVKTTYTRSSWYQTTCSYHRDKSVNAYFPLKTNNYDVWSLQYK